MALATPVHKVILCGEYGVGKSSLFRRFVDNAFCEDSSPLSCIGLDNMKKEFTLSDGRKMKLELWDTAGIEKFATLSSSYYQNASAAILCYSINNPESFGLLTQHLLEIVMQTQTAKIFLCGNKSDLDCDDPITESHVEELKSQCDTMLSQTYQVSCKTGQGVTEMFQDIAEVVHREYVHKFDPSRIRAHEGARDVEAKAQCCNK